MRNLTSFVNRVRQNHAVEHATVHLLTRWHWPLHLVGRSDWNGFYLYGDIETEEVVRAAHEAIDRLRRGETWLAVHPRCGTNLAVSALMGGGAAYALGSLRDDSPLRKLNRIMLGVIGALFLARPLGALAQRHLTTTGDLAGVRGIGEVRCEQRGKLVIHMVPVLH